MEPSAEDDGYKYGDEDEEERKKFQRPPSSYGSMKSDSNGIKEEDEQDEQECDEEVAGVFQQPGPVLQYEAPVYEGTGLQMHRSESPETLYTMTTQQTKPPGANVIETRSSDLELSCESEEEDADEMLITNSPEPPEPIVLEEAIQMDEHGQPGRLHPEQDLPHVFKNIQQALTGLNKDELYKFKINFYQRQSDLTIQSLFEGDLLDFVDKIIELLGLERSLSNTINSLVNITKHEEAEELRNSCKKALIRFTLKQDLIRKYQFIYEGIPQAGKRNALDSVYVEPEISLCADGGVDPSHELRRHPPSLPQRTNADTYISVNNLFRLQRPDGQPVRTVLTSGIPGIGMSVSVGKFCFDWAEQRANKDLQFVFTLPFSSLWILRNKNLSSSQNMSIMDVLEYHNSLCKNKKYLDDEECKFLIIMDSFDCYQTSLDWKNAPIVNDNHTPATLDVLIVNVIRGTLLPKAHVWVLGRQAAVSRIPSNLFDAVSEIKGFNDEMKDNYLTKRFLNAETGARIVEHYKQLPMLHILARQPFVCWMVAKIFGHNFRNEHYRALPPKLTMFYVNILIIQTNRRLQFYYEKAENNLKWSSDDKHMLRDLGKMAFKMLERNTSVFVEEDLKAHSLDVIDVTVFSGLCTELPSPTPPGNRQFCFIHFTVQEFMAALYVFTLFRLESKNVLDSGLLHKFLFKEQPRSAVGLVQCAINRTLNSTPGQYDMFLRFLCGLLSPDIQDKLLSGHLYSRDSPKVSGLEEVGVLLERTKQNCPPERIENLNECLRELTQQEEM